MIGSNLKRTVGTVSLLTLTATMIPMFGWASTPSSLKPVRDEARFRLAVVGLVHGHAWGHLRRIATAPDIELVGIAEPAAALREQAKKIAPGARFFEDYLKLLDEQKPEAVWAFVENDRHLELTEACATRGIHVMFEKPMASSYDEARQMLALARQYKIKLMVNYQMAWWPENYTAHELAESGKLGKIWRVRSIIGHGGPDPKLPNDAPGQAFWAWLNDERRGGGALVDFTCYGAVWLKWYLGMPKTVYAVTTHTRPEKFKTNTNATVLATFADNGIGIIEGSWDLPRSFQDVEVFGNRGSVFMARGRLEAFIGNQRQETIIGALSEGRREPVSYFARRVRAGEAIDGIVGPEFNVDVMQIVEAARLSAKTGKAVNLPLK